MKNIKSSKEQLKNANYYYKDRTSDSTIEFPTNIRHLNINIRRYHLTLHNAYIGTIYIFLTGTR